MSVDDSVDYYTDQLGHEAVAQIERFAQTPEKPFFQYVAFTAAHWPLHAPEATIAKYIDRYAGGWEAMRNDRYRRMISIGLIDPATWPLPPAEDAAEDWESMGHHAWHVHNMAVYAAMVDHMDQAVGRITEALRRTGTLENTVILYFHDNGASPERLKGNAHGTTGNVEALARQVGEQVVVGDQFDVLNGPPFTFGSVGPGWANAQNTPLRRYKANVHEGGACTPAIVHWPAGIGTPGSVTRRRGHVVDVLATCLDLSGADSSPAVANRPVADHEGRSFLPAITGDAYVHEHPYFFQPRRNPSDHSWRLETGPRTKQRLAPV